MGSHEAALTCPPQPVSASGTAFRGCTHEDTLDGKAVIKRGADHSKAARVSRRRTRCCAVRRRTQPDLKKHRNERQSLTFLCFLNRAGGI